MAVDLSQFGSFGGGAQQAVASALARRGQGEPTPALETQGQTSPTASPLPPTPSGGIPIPQGEGTAQQELTGPERSAENREARLIISALKDRLGAISVVEGGTQLK